MDDCRLLRTIFGPEPLFFIHLAPHLSSWGWVGSVPGVSQLHRASADFCTSKTNALSLCRSITAAQSICGLLHLWDKRSVSLEEHHSCTEHLRTSASLRQTRSLEEHHSRTEHLRTSAPLKQTRCLSKGAPQLHRASADFCTSKTNALSRGASQLNRASAVFCTSKTNALSL
jgi:hypothetical protein